MRSHHSCCCQSNSRPRRKVINIFAEPFAWLLSTACLVLVPKCPFCVAGYVAILTGLSLTTSQATWLRHSILLAGIAGLLTLAVLRLRSTRDVIRNIKHQ